MPNGVENEGANPGEQEGATVLLEQAGPFDMAALRRRRKDPSLSRAAMCIPAGFKRGTNPWRHGEKTPGCLRFAVSHQKTSMATVDPSYRFPLQAKCFIGAEACVEQHGCHGRQEIGAAAK